MSDDRAERRRIQKNTAERRNYNRKMLLDEYIWKNKLRTAEVPFEVTLDMEYVNPYDGYHHERLRYLVTDPVKKNFNPTTIKAKLLSKIEISSEEPANWDHIPKVRKYDPLEAKIAEFDAVIAEADADFYAALHGEDDEK